MNLWTYRCVCSNSICTCYCELMCSGQILIFLRIVIRVPPRQEHPEQATNSTYRQAHCGPKKKVQASSQGRERLSTFLRPLLLSRTLGCSRDHSSFWGHLRSENSHSSNRPEVQSFLETFAPSKIAITTSLFDLHLQIVTATCLLDFRLQLCSLTSPTFITSWTVMGWAEFLGKS